MNNRFCYVAYAMMFIFFATYAHCASSTTTPDATALLAFAGREQGLCIVLGCGSRARPTLAADIAVSSKMLVHGIAYDNDALSRVRAAIDRAGVRGRCSAEMIPVSPLPFVPDVANLVVIEDEAGLKAFGVTIDDVMKITAPLGVVAVCNGGKWRSQVKPRPVGMGDWMTSMGSAGDNRVSSDTLAAFPAGCRWQDGVPMNFIPGGWASCRALVTAGGRCITLSPTEYENLDPLRATFQSDLWLTCHDAFNGLPSWKLNCGIKTQYAGLNIRNYAPLVADDANVYTYSKDGLIAVDIADGHIVYTLPVKYPTVRLLLLDGVLVSVGWEEPAHQPGLWDPWQPKTAVGCVQAYATKTGKLLWEKNTGHQDALADNGKLLLLTVGVVNGVNCGLQAIDLNSGNELWKNNAGEFAQDQDAYLTLVAQGVVAVCHQVIKADPKVADEVVAVYSAADGHKLWEQQVGTAKDYEFNKREMVMIGGYIWMNGHAYQAQTGEALKDEITGRMVNLPGPGTGQCVPGIVLDNGRLVINGRSMDCFTRDTTSTTAWTYQHIADRALRGHCIQGVVAANGMFYVAQNSCMCSPADLPGVIGFGPVAALPTVADFQAARPLEKGAAFASAMAAADIGGEWPMFLRDEQRDSKATAAAPKTLAIRWQQPVAVDPGGPLASAWASRLCSTLTAPVVAGKVVVTAAIEEGRVSALDSENGKILWRFDGGGRIDTAPTLYRGRCFFGCHDGWLYALELSTGKLAWRLRVAPLERRMVAFGQVESVWPSPGSVLAHDGVIYATAGQCSESDGGMGVIAVDSQTGSQRWAVRINGGFERSNDLLQWLDGKVVLRDYQLDPATGVGTLSRKPGDKVSLAGMKDESWTKVYQRRSYFTFGALFVSLLLRDADTAYGTLENGQYFAITQAAADKLLPYHPLQTSSCIWNKPPAANKPFALALTPTALLVAGKTVRREGVTGFVQIVQSTDGAEIAQLALPSPVIHQGIAIAGGRIYASLSNGTVICMGGE